MFPHLALPFLILPHLPYKDKTLVVYKPDSGSISLCLPRCTAHHGLQKKLVQLQAIPELQCDPYTCRTQEHPTLCCSKLAQGDLKRIDTKYKVGSATKQDILGSGCCAFMAPSDFQVI